MSEYPREVKDKHIAIERLAEVLPRITVTKRNRTYRIRVKGSDMVTEKTKTSALAWLADIALYAGLDRRLVGWKGRVPSRGVAAWEEAALAWLGRWEWDRRTRRYVRSNP